MFPEWTEQEIKEMGYFAGVCHGMAIAFSLASLGISIYTTFMIMGG